MSPVGPPMLIGAPWPLEIAIPRSRPEIIAPVVVWIMIPPVGPGTSLTTMPFFSVVWIVKPFTAGGPRGAGAGTPAAGAPQPPAPTRQARAAPPHFAPPPPPRLRDAQRPAVK